MGFFIAAASARGLCALLLGDAPQALREELATKFPKARFAEISAAEFAAAAALLERPGEGTELALDIRGTAFERLVWEALRGIAPGAVASYGEIARRIGRPTAARAVARACAANKLAVAIPCHRVVAADGGLGGFRWGIARKRALLALESAPSAARHSGLENSRASAFSISGSG